MVHRLQRSGRDGARREALRRIQSIDDLDPQTRRAVELWAEAVNPLRITEATGVPPLHLHALTDSPAARAYYAEVRRQKDAERVAGAAMLPWLEVWEAVKRSKFEP